MTRQCTFISVLMFGIAFGAAGLGCGNRNDADFTPVGQLAVEGEGPLSYVAPRDGTIYVYGDKDNRLVYSGPIKQGQTFSVEPRAKRLMIDGRVIQEGALDTGGSHRIYLDTRETGSVSAGTLSDEELPNRVIVEQGRRTTEYRAVDPQPR